jgi:hypothetical protein
MLICSRTTSERESSYDSGRACCTFSLYRIRMYTYIVSALHVCRAKKYEAILVDKSHTQTGSITERVSLQHVSTDMHDS